MKVFCYDFKNEKLKFMSEQKLNDELQNYEEKHMHDFAKEKEFTFSGLGLVTDYSLSGQLIGHLVMGAQEVQQCAQELGIPEEKSLLLQHMILSHHGEPEFGAAVRPMCAEAELLSEIDLIDSRMEIYAEALQDLPVGSFSNRIFALDKKIYRHG